MPKKISAETLAAIETLYAANTSQAEIARRLDLSPVTVWKHVHDPNFKIRLDDVRAATKRINAVRIRDHVDKVHDLIGTTAERKEANALKQATGALKDLDQIQAVACGDDQQAGVSAPAPTAVDLKVLIAQLRGA